MADVFKTIFEADAEFQQVLTGLDAINKKYGQSVIAMNQQEAALLSLTAQEKKLLEARNNAQNPNTAVRLTKELDTVRAKILDMNAQLKGTVVANESVLSSSKNVTNEMQKAFGTAIFTSAKTQITAIGTEQKKIATGFTSVSSGANAFLKDTVALNQSVKSVSQGAKDFLSSMKDQGGVTSIKGVDGIFRNIDGSIISSYQNLRKLKVASAEAFGTVEGERLAEQVGIIQKKLNLASEAAKVFASENKFKVVGQLTQEIAANILAFDFQGASEKSKLLASVSSKINFKEALVGVKQLGETLFNVGKSLLLNPLFLLGVTIYAAYEAFESFNKSAERTAGIIDNLFESERRLNDETLSLIRGNRQLAEEIEVSAQREYKVNGERVKAKQKFVAEYLDAVKKLEADEKKLNADADKAREEDGFKLTKSIFEALGGETELTKQQQEGLKKLQLAHNAEMLALQEKFKLENIKITEDEIKAQKEKIIQLNKSIADEASKSKAFDVEFRLKPLSKEQIEKSFQLQRADLARTRDEELRVANLEFADEYKKGEILSKIKQKYGLEFVVLKKKQTLEEIKASAELAALEIAKREEIANTTKTILIGGIETIKQLEEARLEIISSKTVDETLEESQKAAIKLDINKKYYESLIKLNEKSFITQSAIASDEIKNLEQTIALKSSKGFDTTKEDAELVVKRRALDALILESTQKRVQAEVNAEKQAAADKRAVDDAFLKESLDSEDEQLAREQTLLKLRNAAQSQELFDQLDHEKAKLQILEEQGRKFTEEYRAQNDKIALLEKEAYKQRTLEVVGYYEQISQAAIQATNTILTQKLTEIERQVSFQQQQVDNAKSVATRGNAEMLELEDKRLNDLNIKREKYVRAQQALAVVELISNTAIAVSKAAAEGGVAAGVTIAATLVALVAGLAVSRSIASQAAFYKGGEFEGGGYTGEGNPTQTSRAVGSKPYTYHKREFIFNHQKTDQNLDIFRRVHGGQVNLKEWETKVKAYDVINAKVNERAEMYMNPVSIKQSDEYRTLEGKVDRLISAIHGQDRLQLTLTREGIHGIVSSYQARQDLIKELAGGK